MATNRSEGGSSCNSIRYSSIDLASAIALGLAVGWMPKTSMLAFGLAMAAIVLRVPFILFVGTAIASAFTAALVDPWLDRIGRTFLEAEQLQTVWHQFADWPILPWLQWNNSVVLGSAIVSLCCFVPLTIVVRCFHRDRALEIRRSQSGTPVSRFHSNSYDTNPIPRLEPRKPQTTETVHVADLAELGVASTATSVVSTPAKSADSTDSKSTELTIATLVSDDESTSAGILANRKLEPAVSPVLSDESSKRPRAAKRRSPSDRRIAIDSSEIGIRPKIIEMAAGTKQMVSVEATIAEETAFLQETVIEIVRYRSQEAPKARGASKAPLTNRAESKSSPESNESLEPMQRNVSESIHPAIETTIHAAPSVLTPNVIPPPNEATGGTERPREEALRYLLWHLSGVKRPSSQPMQEKST